MSAYVYVQQQDPHGRWYGPVERCRADSISVAARAGKKVKVGYVPPAEEGDDEVPAAPSRVAGRPAGAIREPVVPDTPTTPVPGGVRTSVNDASAGGTIHCDQCDAPPFRTENGLRSHVRSKHPSTTAKA